MKLMDERTTLNSQCRFPALKMTAGRNFQAFITIYLNARRYNETLYRCFTFGGQHPWAVHSSIRHRTLTHATD